MVRSLTYILETVYIEPVLHIILCIKHLFKSMAKMCLKQHISMTCRCTTTLRPRSTLMTCLSSSPSSALLTSPSSHNWSTTRCSGWSLRSATSPMWSSGARSSSTSSRLPDTVKTARTSTPCSPLSVGWGTGLCRGYGKPGIKCLPSTIRCLR